MSKPFYHKSRRKRKGWTVSDQVKLLVDFYNLHLDPYPHFYVDTDYELTSRQLKSFLRAHWGSSYPVRIIEKIPLEDLWRNIKVLVDAYLNGRLIGDDVFILEELFKANVPRLLFRAKRSNKSDWEYKRPDELVRILGIDPEAWKGYPPPRVNPFGQIDLSYGEVDLKRWEPVFGFDPLAEYHDYGLDVESTNFDLVYAPEEFKSLWLSLFGRVVSGLYLMFTHKMPIKRCAFKMEVTRGFRRPPYHAGLRREGKIETCQNIFIPDARAPKKGDYQVKYCHLCRPRRKYMPWHLRSRRHR